MEIRSFGESAAPKHIEGRTIEGYAVVFNRDSQIMFDREKKRCFIERISPNAITPELLQRSDVKALLEHNKERLLARSFKGQGSLTLSIDDYGVKYRFEAPETVDGDTALELVRRGDFFGSSFAYTADEKSGVKYEKRSDGILQRTVDLASGFYDISIVSNPAYFGTNVNVRSLDSFFEETEESPVDESYKDDVKELRQYI